jgi:hypothetical protein
LVRQWKARTAVETDIRHLLGETPKAPGDRKEDVNALAMKHLALLCEAVLNGSEERAESMAAALAERYGF